MSDSETLLWESLFMRPLGFLFAFVVVLFSCGGSSQSTLGPEATSLGITGVDSFSIAGTFLVARVDEELAGDLTGDGDELDHVLQIMNLDTGRFSTVAYATTSYGVDGEFVVFVVIESGQGADLNGDGDMLDSILYVHDLVTETTTDLLAVATSGSGSHLFHHVGPVVAFAVSESSHGADIDGDGSLDHDVVHVYEANLDRLTSLDLTTTKEPLVSEDRVFVSALESASGDLNGDGDALDRVLHVYDRRTSLVTNLGRSVVSLLDAEDPLVAFTIHEGAQGDGDLNADGDETDTLLEVHDLDAGTFYRSREPSFQAQIVDGLVAFVLEEALASDPDRADINDDGDALDRIMFFYDWATASLTNTRLAIGLSQGPVGLRPALAARRSAFSVSELGEGVDLNGDGDSEDYILATFDGRTGVVDRTDLTLFPSNRTLEMDSRFVVCGVIREEKAGEPLDPVAFYLDFEDGAVRDLGLSITELKVNDGHLAARVEEFGQNTDLNGDGDTQDGIVHVTDLQTGETLNIKVCTPTGFISGEPGFELEGRFLVAIVHESCQSQDLNGDDDQDDDLLFVFKLP